MAEQATWADLWTARELFMAPLLCAAIAGTALGFLGVWVVLRRMTFVSAAVSQAAGLGVALAFYAQIHLGLALDPVATAVALALSTTVLLSFDPARLQLPREGVLGFAFALCGGGAVLVSDRIAQEAHDIQAILFGSAVLVRPVDLVLVAVSGGLVLALQLWWLRGLTFAAFDPDSARVQRLPVGLLNGAVLLSIGVLVGVSARALGALPVFAFSTLPALAVLVLGPSLPRTFALAAALGGACGVGGYLVAFFWDFPVGGSQTVVAALLVPAALLVRGARRLGRAAR
jgi:zinc transport system permease protein